jgi:sugar-phosphatase
MDGVLLDSEPFWKVAEINVFNSAGVPLTNEMCDATVGMRLKDVVNLWHGKYPWNTQNPTLAEVETEIINRLILLIRKKGVLNGGVIKALNFFESKNLPLAIASSSNMNIIDAVVDKFCLRKHFSVIHSAEFEEHGKPHPATYLSAAKLLVANPSECRAIEESPSGLRSAIAAGMRTIAVPEARSFDNPEFDIADLKLRTLVELNEENFSKLNSL